MEDGVEIIKFDGSFYVRERGRARLVEERGMRMNCRSGSGTSVKRKRVNGHRLGRM
jgi:hypothetical protein